MHYNNVLIFHKKELRNNKLTKRVQAEAEAYCADPLKKKNL